MAPTGELVIGIIGTGPIGLGSAALASEHGFESVFWSPSGALSNQINANGTVAAQGAVQQVYRPGIAQSLKDLVQNSNVILIAVPANGHKDVIDQIAEHLRKDHTVIISSHVPFGCQYLQKKLAARGIKPLIIAWATTVVSGRKPAVNQVNVGSVRDQVDMITLPKNRAAEGLQLCQRLFGDRFVLLNGSIAIALSNLNPQNHLGIALCNFTRMEKGETWCQAEHITPSVGRLLEQLDNERTAIADALHQKVRNIFEHFSRSFHVPAGSVAEMSAEMVKNGHKGNGPTSLDTRYVLEDVPYGLVPTAWLGKLAGRPAKLHQAGITLLNALYGCDLHKENKLMDALNMEDMSLEDLEDFLSEETIPRKPKEMSTQSKSMPHRANH